MEVNQGVLVQDVGNGPAAEAGIQPGDVILSLNHHDVKNTGQFARLVKDLPKDKAVPVLVKRNDAALFLALKISATG
jgi:serine protease Do